MIYLVHMKFVIQHRSYQLNDQDNVYALQILTEMKERKNMLQVGKDLLFLQVKTTL